jgi:DinB superfamily
MSATLSVSPQTQAAVEACKKNLHMCTHRLKTTFSFVPDDKLDFKPGETCKSALQIIAHCAVSNHNFISIIKREMEGDPKERFAESKRKEEAITSKDAALVALDESVAAVAAALDTINDENIGKDIPTPFFTAPMMFWMYLPARHMDNHASQIDYIQTIWGDMDWHMA